MSDTQNNRQRKTEVRAKVDVTSPVKLVFGGLVRLTNRFSFTGMMIFFAFFMHSYFVHAIFSPYLIAGAIVLGIIWILCASTETSWFDKKRGTFHERLTKCERALGA